MSGGADLRSSWVSPILSPVKERTGRVASWEVSERGFVGVLVLRELGLKVEEESFGRKMEEEKNERDVVLVKVAISRF